MSSYAAAPQFLHQQRLVALGVLAGGTAHELKNLLTPLLLAAEITVSDIAPDHPAQKTLASVLLAARRARDLVARFSEYGAVRPVQSQSLAFDQIATEVLALLRPLFSGRIKLEFTVAPGLPRIVADPLHVHQVVTNLVMNAWQAIESGEGTIKLHLDRATVVEESREALGPTRGNYVRLTVADNGVGMEPNVCARMFDEFFSTKSTSHGSGLGLTIVRAIVREYRAGLTVETRRGHGSTFSLYWPIASSELL